MLSLVTPEKRVPEDHPLRQVKILAEDALPGSCRALPQGSRRGLRKCCLSSPREQRRHPRNISGAFAGV